MYLLGKTFITAGGVCQGVLGQTDFEDDTDEGRPTTAFAQRHGQLGYFVILADYSFAMLDGFTILLLLVVGVILIVVELIFIPGTTVFGIAGLALTIIGVVLSFVAFGSGTGLFVLLATFAALGVIMFFSLRSGAWEKVSLKKSNQSRVNEDVKHSVWKGDVGIALSALRPSGNVEFNETILEVSTLGSYVDAGAKVRVIEVRPNKILVEEVG